MRLKKKRVPNNRNNIISYALVEHMKTISKLSIIKPINEYDYI